MTTAVVLLSGGIDSTTCLTEAVLRHGPDEVLAVSFRYGQKHAEELTAGQHVADFLHVDRRVIDLPNVFGGGPSTLVVGGPENPKGTYEELPEGQSPTYVPFRNGNLLSTATAIASTHDAREVWFGAHAEDAERWAYPDCTPEFIGAMANAIFIGTYMKTRLVTPLEWMSKIGVIRWGLEIGAPYGLTMSCYNGLRPACGECPTCRSRRGAFLALGLEDPIEYAR